MENQDTSLVPSHTPWYYISNNISSQLFDLGLWEIHSSQGKHIIDINGAHFSMHQTLEKCLNLREFLMRKYYPMLHSIVNIY